MADGGTRLLQGDSGEMFLAIAIQKLGGQMRVTAQDVNDCPGALVVYKEEGFIVIEVQSLDDVRDEVMLMTMAAADGEVFQA